MAEVDSDQPVSGHTANILGALSVLILDRVQEAWQADLDLSPMAAAALVQVNETPGSSIERVATVIGLSHSATVRIVDKLAARGLVTKDRGEDDARRQILALSKAGKRLAQQLHAARNRVTDEMLRHLSGAEIAGLHRAVAGILHRAIEPGPEGDITCRVCDERRCSADICPIRV